MMRSDVVSVLPRQSYDAEGGARGGAKMGKGGGVRRLAHRRDIFRDAEPFDNTPGLVEIPVTNSDNYNDNKFRFSFRKLWAFTGPGFLMSVAYLDPGNIESDIQTASVAKFKLLWVLMWSTVMGLILQIMSVRIGNVTGLNLAEICCKEYPRPVRLLLWIMIEIAIIASDVQEVIGSALAINILSNGAIPIWAGCIITLADTFAFLFLESAGLRKLEILFGTLIFTMGACFFYIYLTIKPDQSSLWQGLVVPWCKDCKQGSMIQLAGIVGSVIMPHNLYLHSALSLSRNVDRSNDKRIKEANIYFGIESGIALTIAFVINLFIVTVFAEGFSSDNFGDASIGTAAAWLESVYGNSMKIVWAVGILAAGQSSTITGTYAGQFVMSGFLKLHWSKWRRVLFTRLVAVSPTILVAWYAVHRMHSLNTWLNVLQSVQLPFALIPVLQFTNSQRIMGVFANSALMMLITWLLAVLVMTINMYLLVNHVVVDIDSPLLHGIIFLATFFYMCFIVYLMLGVSQYRKIKVWLWQKMVDIMPDDEEDEDEGEDDGLEDEPGRPEKPLPSDCCGSGCQPCVKDIYKDELKMWRSECRDRLAGGVCNKAMQMDVKGTALDKNVYYKFRIIEKTQENHNCFRYRFAMPTNTTKYKSGHHVILRWKNEKATLTRQYTLINDDVSFFEVIIKIYEDGRMGKYIKTWNIGDMVEWRGPIGHFHYKPNQQRTILLLAAGTGFAPMIQVIREVLNNTSDRTEIRLLYSSRSSEDLLCKYYLDDWNQYSKFSMIYIFSKRNVSDELEKMDITDLIHRGRCDRELLSSELEKLSLSDTKVMICGSKMYNKSMSDTVKQLGIQDNNVFIF